MIRIGPPNPFFPERPKRKPGVTPPEGGAGADFPDNRGRNQSPLPSKEKGKGNKKYDEGGEGAGNDASKSPKKPGDPGYNVDVEV